MCKHHQKAQSDVCLICLEPILKNISFVHILNPLPICSNCIKKFHTLHLHEIWNEVPLTILYAYDEFFKSLLFQYKGLYDYALKDVFFALYKPQLQKKYRNHIYVIAPSNEEDNQIRGFAPVEEIVKTISPHVFTGLYKKEKYKQSSLSYQERQEVENRIGIRNGELLKGKKIVLVDDVMTSGATLKACFKLVKEYSPQSIDILVLSKKVE